jgi:S-adenosylmethionine:tRNA ribosyltransferase-isomerase
MKIEEFDYLLPRSLIAQYPPPQRGESRLMVVRRDSGKIEHRTFRDIPDFLHAGDLLVTNNSRVLPVRLIGKSEMGKRCEFLLIPPRNGTQNVWEALVKDSKKMKPGTRIQFGEDFYGIVEEVKNGRGKLRFPGKIAITEHLQKMGRIPLPPYIKREDEPLDRERYQTIFAESDGSIACPTAGLHFTRDLVQSVRAHGGKMTSITLHVGIGTFAPVRTEQVEEHSMESEWIEISEETKQAIEQTRQTGGRVVAVGTTTTRALESFVDPEGHIHSGSGFTSLFIHPPYRFRVIDGLITNFHLPKSTLVMLVSAWAGKELLMKAYREAVEEKYRFYSYGDAMLIL